ncbi:11431_t:CDS:2, partial [Racocetra persica]
LLLVKNWVRTNDSVSSTPELSAQLRVNRTIGINQLIGGSVNTSRVLQAPDAFHYTPSVESIKVKLWEIGFKVDPDFSNAVNEISFIIKTLYNFAGKGKVPVNYLADFRFIKSSEALFATTLDHDSNALYCQMDIVAFFDTPDWEELIQLLGQRYFNNKYNA